MGVGAGLYMCDVVVKKFTFAISSPDEFLYFNMEPRLYPQKCCSGLNHSECREVLVAVVVSDRSLYLARWIVVVVVVVDDLHREG